VDDGRGERAVLRQRDRRLGGDAGARRGAVDDEDQRPAKLLDQLDGRAGRAQVVRARSRGNDDEIGEADDRRDRPGDRRGRIDDQQANADVS